MIIVLIFNVLFAADYQKLGFQYEHQYKSHVQNAIRSPYTSCIPCGEKTICTELSNPLVTHCNSLNHSESVKRIFPKGEKLRYSAFVSSFNRAKREEQKSNLPANQRVRAPDYPLSERGFRNNRNASSGNKKYEQYFTDAYPTVAPAVAEVAPVVAVPPAPVVQTVVTSPVVESAPAPAPVEPLINCTFNTIGKHLDNPDFCACVDQGVTNQVNNLALSQCKQLYNKDYTTVRDCTEDLACTKNLLDVKPYSEAYNTELRNIQNIEESIIGTECRVRFADYISSRRFSQNYNSEDQLYQYFKAEYAPRIASSVLQTPQANLDNQLICNMTFGRDRCNSALLSGGIDKVEGYKFRSVNIAHQEFAIEQGYYSRFSKVSPASEQACNGMVSNWSAKAKEKLLQASQTTFSAAQRVSSCKASISVTGDSVARDKQTVDTLLSRIRAYDVKARGCKTATQPPAASGATN